VITPPLSPHHPTAALVPLPERLFVYEFEIPQALVGLLIGKYGAFVNQIKVKTGASLLIKDRDRRCKLCAIEGIYYTALTFILKNGIIYCSFYMQVQRPKLMQPLS
jgi:hypothetical protein